MRFFLNNRNLRTVFIMKRSAPDSETALSQKLKRFRAPTNKKKMNNAMSTENSTKESDPSLSHSSSTIATQIITMEHDLSMKLEKIKFRAPVAYVYNPLDYAFDVHSMYVKKYCNTAKTILFLGMNPGPWGMSQTGVPFGEITMVRDWLRISGPVGKPAREQADRKVTGFDCTRSEVSGKRLWGLFQELCGTPENFFRHSYVHNYCPIALMDQKGGNITPAEIKGAERETIDSLCDLVLADIIKLLEIQIVVGIGKFAEKRAQIVVNASKLSAKVLCIPHPSPRAAGNQNWNDKARKKLEELELLQYFTK